MTDDHVRQEESRLAHEGSLAFYRDSLDRLIRHAVQLTWVLPPVIAVMIGLTSLIDDRESAPAAWVFLPLFAAAVLWRRFVVLPRLRRERHELG